MSSIIAAIVIFFIFIIFPSLRFIRPTEVGLVTKRFASKKLPEDNPIAFKGEAGYQFDLLMPGLQFKFWMPFRIEKFPRVQVSAGEIGVVIAQPGKPLSIGAKSAIFKNEFSNYITRRRRWLNLR